MTPDRKTSPASAALERYLAGLEKETPALREVLKAFGQLRVRQVELREGLPALDSPLPQSDPQRSAQGLPLATVEALLQCAPLELPEYLEQAASALLPGLEQGFPALQTDINVLRAALPALRSNARACLEALLKGSEDGLRSRAAELGLRPHALEFILLQLAKPLLEKRAQALASLLDGREWLHGSCPVCGSLPEMAYLKGEGGQRWLRCSLCAHHWRFARTACPVCGNEDQDKLEFFFAEGRERERADSCLGCNKYLVTLDVRGLDAPPVWDAAALGLVHLDLLAQERGLAPAAWCPWNQIR